MTKFRKGDIIAILETRVTKWVDNRPTKMSTIVHIVRIDSVTRGGVAIKTYSMWPSSLICKYENPIGRYKLLTISDDAMQTAARKLFNAASFFLDFDSVDAAKLAIQKVAQQ
jgi:hypothetical protein